jgi:hypothetical protein
MLTTISQGEQLSALRMVFISKGILNGTATSYAEEFSARKLHVRAAHNDPSDSDSCHYNDNDLSSHSEWADNSDLDDNNMDNDMDDNMDNLDDDGMDNDLDNGMDNDMDNGIDNDMDNGLDNGLDDSLDDDLDDVLLLDIGDPDNVDSMDINGIDAQDIGTTNQSGNRMECDDSGHMPDEASPIDGLAEVSCLSLIKLAARHHESICFSQVLT